MTSGSVRVKTRGVVKLRNATARELLNSIIHYHFGQTLNGESLKEIGRPPSFTSAWFSQTMTLKIQMVVNLAPVSLSNKKVNFYTFPRLTFLKTKNATENAYKSIFEPLDFKFFWGSMPPHTPCRRSKLASSCSEVWLVAQQAFGQRAVKPFNICLVTVNFSAPAPNSNFVIFHFFGDRAHKLVARVNLEQLTPFQRPAFVDFF